MNAPRFLTHAGDRFFGEPTLKAVTVDGIVTAAMVLIGKLIMTESPGGFRGALLAVAVGAAVMVASCLTLIELCRYIVDRNSLGTVLAPTVEISPDGSKLYRTVQAPRSAVAGSTSRKELTTR